MNRGMLESWPVQHLTAARNPNWWTNVSDGLMPPPPELPPPTTTHLLPDFFSSPASSSSSSYLPPTSNPNFSSWLHNSDDLPLDQPWSLSQLILSGLMMGDEETMEMMNHHHQNQDHSYQEKKLENMDDEHVVRHHSSIIQESNHNNNHNGLNLFKVCNSSKISGSSIANKKPKLQVPSSQSTLKVRKEKLGGRIAALHQLVSPFGKTDTASVLSEAVGYIRFLHNQVEVLSETYFGTPSRNNIMHQHLVNEYCMKISRRASTSFTNNQESNLKEEPKKNLRSRGLCLVSTLQISNDHDADYW